MTSIGIVEGFFGPSWSHESRISFADFLHKYGGDFYIYAPKRDAHLRKEWREKWDRKFLSQMTQLRDAFQKRKLKFGVALSPFGLGSNISQEDWSLLAHKFQELSELKLDYLGLFFDDMPSTDDLLKVQKEVVDLALKYFPRGLIFCPSYYTYDPILDKVFGQRPAGYMEGLKTLPPEVEICWTGPKVISEEITQAHLQEVIELLGRKPFIWENLFANDGPRNCKFLKLRYFTGRDSSLIDHTNGLGFNLMNQPYLSQLLYLSSLLVMQKNITSEKAFEEACFELYSKEFALHLLANRKSYLESGLDKLTELEKQTFLQELAGFSEPACSEIRSWLNGEYLVGPECLTD
jgi:hyaluronoglucosaminidase